MDANKCDHRKVKYVKTGHVLGKAGELIRLPASEYRNT